MKKTKVFCIGFHKTGTSSLGVALGKLGYSVVGFYPFRHLAAQEHVDLKDIENLALEEATKHDAAQDSPWPILYRQMDEAFPGSKFIHITRDRDAWINSALKDFGKNPNAMRKLIYGAPFPKGNEDIWLERYDQHNEDVQSYFADRPTDFISLDLEKGEVSWDNICPFLGEAAPDIPWPHANKRSTKKRKMKFYKVLDKLGLKRP